MSHGVWNVRDLGAPKVCFMVQMDPSGKSKGPPPAVKKVLSLFGSGREEDRMVGYLSFLKVGPKLLRFLPGPPSCVTSNGNIPKRVCARVAEVAVM